MFAAALRADAGARRGRTRSRPSSPPGSARGQAPNTAVLRLPAYFGLLGLITGGAGSPDGPRSLTRRFQFFPILWTALAASVLLPIEAAPEPSNLRGGGLDCHRHPARRPWNAVAAACTRASRKQGSPEAMSIFTILGMRIPANK